MVHYNLGKTLEDVENIAALPAEAAAAEAMLHDDYQLLQVLYSHRTVTCQTYRSMCILHRFLAE